MVVSLIVSNTLDGAQVNDGLLGGGTGLDYGVVGSGTYAPLINKTANTGRKDMFISHDAVTDPITQLSTHIQQFGLDTGFAYGGAQSAATDIADILALGLASGVSRNNADALSGGVWIDMDADVSDALQFDRGSRPTLARAYGENPGGGVEGSSLATAFAIAADAMVYNDGGETLASAPTAGTVGKAGDTVNGDSAHTRTRVYIPSSFVKSGFFQFETIYNYAFTG